MRVRREHLHLAEPEGVKRLARALGIRDAEWESRGDDWLASVPLAWTGRRRYAVPLCALFVLAGALWFPRSTAGLYAAAQALAVAVAIVAFGAWIRRREVGRAGQLAGLIVVTAEALLLVMPFGAAWLRGTDAASEWDPALVVRAVEYAALAVVVFLTWRTARSWYSLGPSSPPTSGRGSPSEAD